jgi:hypothetical protein
VQEPVQLGHVTGQEAAVGPDRVAAQRCLARLDVLAQVGEDLLLGLPQRDGGPQHLLGEAGGPVHLHHHGGHPLELLGGRPDDHVDAVTEHVELGVGDQGGDLDEQVRAQVEARHLAVDPHQSVARAICHGAHPTGLVLRDGPAHSPAGDDCVRHGGPAAYDEKPTLRFLRR